MQADQRIEDKLDALLVAQIEIRADLREHMRRTEVAERRLDAVEKVAKLWWVLLGASLLGTASQHPELLTVIKALASN